MTRPLTYNDSRHAGRSLVIVFVTVAALAVGAVAWGVSKLKPEGDSPEIDAARKTGKPAVVSDWYVIEPRSFDLTVHASGELEAKSKVEVKCLVEGTSTITSLVPEGKFVKQGDPLVKIADDELIVKIEEEQLKVETSRADQIADEQALAIAESEAKSTREAAELKVALAELDLDKWEKGTDPQKQRELKLAMEKAVRNLERAKRDLELSKQLYEEKFISLNEKEDDEIKVIEGEAEMATADLNLKVYDQYTRPKEQRQVQSDVTQAKAELERTLRKNESTLAQAKAKLAASIRTLKIHEDRLAKLDEQLKLTNITAPRDGMVVYATTSSSSSRFRGDPMAEGRQVRFNEPIIILPDTSQMVASLKVQEAMVRQVKVGQRVTVSIDARRGTPLEGKVISKGVMAADAGWVNPDLREYDVKVELESNADGELKPSMRCEGQLFLGHVTDSLAAPIQAVYTEGRERYCYVDAGGGHVRRVPIKIGKASETLVEITSGLTAGERVLLRRPRPNELLAG